MPQTDDGRTDDRRILISWALLTESSRAKNQKMWFISKVSISTLVQPQGNLELKFERNAFNRFWDNCNTIVNGDDGHRTTDGRHVEAPHHELCWQSQAELKIVWRYGGEGATHKMWPGSMKRFPRNLSLRTTDVRQDAYAISVALLRKSSRAKRIYKIKLCLYHVVIAFKHLFLKLPKTFMEKPHEWSATFSPVSGGWDIRIILFSVLYCLCTHIILFLPQNGWFLKGRIVFGGIPVWLWIWVTKIKLPDTQKMMTII